MSATVSIKVRQEIAAIDITEQLFDSLFPPQGDPPTQEDGPQKFLESVKFMMALYNAAQTGRDINAAYEFVQTQIEEAE